MENSVNYTHARCICLIFALLLIPVSVLAYDDTGVLKAHSEINRQAILLFEKTIMPNDPYLKDTSLDGDKSKGLAWDRREEGGPGDTLFPVATRPDKPVEKSMKEWFISGAYSADEPEGVTALVHFYDPTAPEGAGYLTDGQTLTRLLAWGWNPQWANPHLDAVQWGLKSHSGPVFSQEYSYEDAHKNLIKALAAKENYNEYYGKAWRGVGETMHMVADMTIPAHVRNDAHAAVLRDADPYESTTAAKDIIANAKGNPADIQTGYKTDVETLMKSVAKFTNNNYFSKDTIDLQASSCTTYSMPAINSLEKSDPLAGGEYLHATINGVDTRMVNRKPVANSFWSFVKNVVTGIYYIDKVVVFDQRKVLVPTAIRADAAVLDRFLPRFSAKMSYVEADPNNPNAGDYIMHGTITLVDPDNQHEWTNMPINNGAIIILTDGAGKITRIPIDPQSVSNMNDFTYKFSKSPGDKVQLIYDLGGYIINAKPDPYVNKIVCDCDGFCSGVEKNWPAGPVGAKSLLCGFGSTGESSDHLCWDAEASVCQCTEGIALKSRIIIEQNGFL